MAHTYEDQKLAYDEWLAARNEMQLRAYVVAEVFVTFNGDIKPDAPYVEEYKAARLLEREAYNRYAAIIHGEGVTA